MLLNAILCVWNEEDIIESTVKHAFAQGCSHVYIIDNASTDRTVELAKKAGAILADSFESKYFDEIQKIAYLNTIVRNYNAQSDEDHIWWLYLDADEFPNIDCKIRLADFLASLDPSVRAVHGYLFEHLPTHPPYHVPGRHPADFMPLAVKSRTSKIPLLRYDKNTQHLYSGAGSHTFDTCGKLALVAEDMLHIHHFNYRRPEHSLGRLKRLIAKNADGTSRVDKLDGYAKLRTRSPKARSEYHDRYAHAKSLYGRNQYAILTADELPYGYGNLVRWHDPHEAQGEDDTALSRGIRHFFLGNYDAALCGFSDALNGMHDQKMRQLLYVKMAACISCTNKVQALALLRQIMESPDREVREYAARQCGKIQENAMPGQDTQDRATLAVPVQQYCSKFEQKFFL
jgi:glycosyltransferase involved in cell wall biosynthesis